jgi:hypothetical protein
MALAADAGFDQRSGYRSHTPLKRQHANADYFYQMSEKRTEWGLAWPVGRNLKV